MTAPPRINSIALRAEGWSRIAMRPVVLTACRKNEGVCGRWSEIDRDAAKWETLAERMKARRAHWVLLSRQAVQWLRELRTIVPEESDLLFPTRGDPSRPMADRSLNAVMERLGPSGQGTPHGMRAAFSTYFNATGANIDLIEHCLTHVPAIRVRAAYNRHQYKEERRTMLQAWADFLDSSNSIEAPAPKATPTRRNRRHASIGVKMASLGGTR